MMYVTRVVHFPHQRACRIRRLLSSEDMEVVVGCMSAGMSLRSDSRPKDDEVPAVLQSQ